MPLKLDIEYEFMIPPAEGETGSPVKKKLKIPYTEFGYLSEPAVTDGNKRLSFKKLRHYLAEHETELELPKNWQKNDELLANVLSLVCQVRNITDTASLECCLQAWLMTMTRVGKGLSALMSKFGFDMKDLLEDVFHLLKTTKDAKTCEQALSFLNVCSEDKLLRVCGLESISDIPTSDLADPDELPDWLAKSFFGRLIKQLGTMTVNTTS